jgi:hypothetical protein
VALNKSLLLLSSLFAWQCSIADEVKIYCIPLTYIESNKAIIALDTKVCSEDSDPLLCGDFYVHLHGADMSGQIYRNFDLAEKSYTSVDQVSSERNASEYKIRNYDLDGETSYREFSIKIDRRSLDYLEAIKVGFDRAKPREGQITEGRCLVLPINLPEPKI